YSKTKWRRRSAKRCASGGGACAGTKHGAAERRSSESVAESPARSDASTDDSRARKPGATRSARARAPRPRPAAAPPSDDTKRRRELTRPSLDPRLTVRCLPATLRPVLQDLH